jgi:hypothetical protein
MSLDKLSNKKDSNLQQDNYLNDEYLINIDKAFSQLVKQFNKLQLEDHANTTITKGDSLIIKGTKFLHILKAQVSSLETLITDCSDFIDEVKQDLSVETKPENFIFLTKHGMLSYPGRDTINKVPNKNDILNEFKNKQTSKETNKISIERVLIPEYGYYLKLPVVNNINQIPPAMYYVKPNVNKNSDQKNVTKPGIYININGNYARIPFPEISDSKKEYDRKHSIRCKYATKQECDLQRSKMAGMYNSNIRTCNFAHKGDSIIKIGYPSRCPSVPNFGNPSTIAKDIKAVNVSDIKNMLLYGLNDIIASAIWLDYNLNKGNIYDDLDNA